MTARGEQEAAAAGSLLDAGRISLVLVSPRRRAQRTAVLAGLADPVTVDDLQEWDYGDYEGMTTAEIRRRTPGWSIWDGPCPGGETAEEVGGRADRVIDRALQAPEDSTVALVAHGHILRVLGARWIRAEVTAGGCLALDTAAVCELGWEHGNRVVHRWNVVAGAKMGR